MQTRPARDEGSLILKRSIKIAGHETSVSLEDEFWDALQDIAAFHNTTAAALVAQIDSGREKGGLSCAIRLFVLRHYRRGTEYIVTGSYAPLWQNAIR
jgi:predicted DNA-binding ribbon-helix-helix protein